jgi:hypothetical protein
VTAANSSPPPRGLTRRQALKAALAGVSLTLPLGLGRVLPAYAAPAGDCYKGCQYVAFQKYNSAMDVCEAAEDISFTAVVFSLFTGAGGTVTAGLNLVNTMGCADHAILADKAAAYNCNLPKCGTFDPVKDHPNCKNCPPENCCTQPSSVQGYTCCAVCCAPSGDGCESSSTVCGG